MIDSVTPALGCVLAIRDRPAETLERTLQTYVYQTVQPVDKIVLDYGSESSKNDSYRSLCQEYGWTFISVRPLQPQWSLSDAYNRAVSALVEEVDLVFKSDVDVLLGCNVLETAATLARDRLCIFSCLTTVEGVNYPPRFRSHADLVELICGTQRLETMCSEGMHAFPKRWFERIGGYDLRFVGWGYEDSDLRERAKRSVGVVYETNALLIHQWHPRSHRPDDVSRNRGYYDQMKNSDTIVRNEGMLCARTLRCPDEATRESVDDARPRISSVPQPGLRLAFATRSMNENLYRASGELLGIDHGNAYSGFECTRHRLIGMGSFDYFRALLELDADWIVNVDEDAFVLDPNLLESLVGHMKAEGYAACGMPDGGVVPIRRHNPVACNAFFNVFDARRIRKVWSDWPRVITSGHKPEYEHRVAPFAARGPFAFDHFERYYAVFFALLAAGEKVLYLDAEEWSDGVSTLLKDPGGKPFLIHCWYTRNWDTSYHTRQRYRVAVACARDAQGLRQAPTDLFAPAVATGVAGQ